MAVLREHSMYKAVEAALPGEEILSVALAFHPGTTRAQSAAALVGEVAGGAMGGWDGAGLGSGVGLFGANLAMRADKDAASFVLAVTATDVHVLGRHSVGPLGSNHNLTPLTSFPRATLAVTHHVHGIVRDVTFTDTATNESATVECKPLGSNLSQFLEVVGSTEQAEPSAR